MSSSVKTSTGHLPGHDGTRLFVRQFFPESRIRAGVVIAHGLGEHSGRYRSLAELFTRSDILVTAFDHRGHGQSDGKRGHVNRFSDYILDLGRVTRQSSGDNPGSTPLFILGHSMGGLIALGFALQHPDLVNGLVASSPALGTSAKIPGYKVLAAKIMSRIYPQLSFDNQLDPQYISHDSTVVRDYINDPLVHSRITARLFTEMTNAMEQTARNAGSFSVPLLIQAAGNDMLVDPEACRDFYSAVPVSDATLKFYQNLYHEIYNEEPESRRQVVADLEQWLESRIR